MKTISVVAAIIKKEDQILIAKRNGGDFDGMWEFPGGKIEVGETAEAALKREILEELSMDISVDSFLMNIVYDYPNFTLNMNCYVCSPIKSDYELNEHSDVKFVRVKDLNTNLNWVPADVEVVSKIIKEFS